MPDIDEILNKISIGITKGGGIVELSSSIELRGIEEAKTALEALLLSKVKEAQLGMIEYYDQIPNNESMDWKGLFSDNRKQIEYELSELTKQSEGK